MKDIFCSTLCLLFLIIIEVFECNRHNFNEFACNNPFNAQNSFSKLATFTTNLLGNMRLYNKLKGYNRLKIYTPKTEPRQMVPEVTTIFLC